MKQYRVTSDLIGGTRTCYGARKVDRGPLTSYRAELSSRISLLPPKRRRERRRRRKRRRKKKRMGSSPLLLETKRRIFAAFAGLSCQYFAIPKNKREKERKKQKRNRRNVNFYEISFVHSTSRRLDLSRLCIGKKVSCRRVDRLAASSRTRPARAVQCNSPREPGRERESTGFRSLFVKGARVRTTTFPTTVETL